MVRKKGAAHVEMVISFLFFVTFLFFIFVVLKPYDSQTSNRAAVISMFDSFEENTRTSLTSLFLKANYTGEESCFFIELPNELFVFALVDRKSIVTSVNNVESDSEIENGGGINIVSGSEIFYKVHISPDFMDENLLETFGTLTNYTLGSIFERSIVSYDKLGDMHSDYSDNYDSLKASLKIPEVFDFAIVSDNLPLNMERKIPDSAEVVADEFVMEVLYPNGTIVNTKFILKVW